MTSSSDEEASAAGTESDLSRREAVERLGLYGGATGVGLLALMTGTKAAASSYAPPPLGSKGNNGFGNGGGDPAPGKSGTNRSPNAAEKLADKVR